MSQIRIPIPAVDFQPPVYICRRATKPFHLDGNINKPFWEDAPFTDAFLDIEGSHMPTPRFLTRAKMLWVTKISTLAHSSTEMRSGAM